MMDLWNATQVYHVQDLAGSFGDCYLAENIGKLKNENNKKVMTSVFILWAMYTFV